jgi:hypothetical protein
VSQILTGFSAFGLVFTLSAAKSLAKMALSITVFTNYLLSATMGTTLP